MVILVFSDSEEEFCTCEKEAKKLKDNVVLLTFSESIDDTDSDFHESKCDIDTASIISGTSSKEKATETDLRVPYNLPKSPAKVSEFIRGET